MEDMTEATAVAEATATQSARICETEFPLSRIPPHEQFALALITRVEGPSYRPLGAMMVIGASGTSHGSLSSGCLERDVILRAQDAMKTGRSVTLRYGRGSPFRDIELPCGGGLDISILPDPARGPLENARTALERREVARLVLPLGGEPTQIGRERFELTLLPQIRFCVLGKGAEAACFATLARQAGYPVSFFSPDPETLSAAGFGSISTGWPADAKVDGRTAVTLFFHDHDPEAALLHAALAGPAFYIGAQGSLRAHQARKAALTTRGVTPEQIDRLASPFGLIPSARDPRTLAVSVLAHVLDRARLMP